MLRDSRAQAIIISEPLLPAFKPILNDQPFLKHVVVSGGNPSAYPRLADLMAAAGSDFAAAPTRADDPCFWLYSSGSTGTPKGTVHTQMSPIRTAELYGQPILGIRESDVVFSAAKLFFAYGLGNALSFPLSVGATTVLLSERPTPASVCRILRQHRPTIFYGVPTLYSALLASPELPKREELTCAAAHRLERHCLPTSAVAGLSTPGSISSMAWVPPRCCTSSCRTGPATFVTALQASRFPAMTSAW